MSALSDRREIVREAVRQGWRLIERTKHIQLYSPDGHTIVTTSRGAPNETSFTWRTNLLRDLKAGGFDMGATTSLGDALREAQATAPRPPMMRMSEAILIVLGKHPDGIPIAQLHDEACFLRPGIPYNTMSGLLRNLQDKNRAYPCSKGIWKLGSANGAAGPSSPPVPSPRAELPPTGSPAGALVTPEAKGAATAGSPAGDPSDLEQDLVALDEALAALGRIEAVVRRHREVIKQLATLKQLLSNFGAIK